MTFEVEHISKNDQPTNHIWGKKIFSKAEEIFKVP